MINWIFAAILGVSYILQSTFAYKLAIFGVSPDFVLVILMACSINLGRESGLVMGFVTGIAADLLSGGSFGFVTLLYTCSAAAAGLMGTGFLGKNPITATLIAAAVAAASGLVQAVVLYASMLDRAFGMLILKYVIIFPLYCAVLEFFAYVAIDGISMRFYMRRG